MMAFISGLFGHQINTPIQLVIPPLSPIIEASTTQEATVLSTGIVTRILSEKETVRTSTEPPINTENLETYNDSLYGFNFKHPKKVVKQEGGSEFVSFVITNEQKERGYDAFSITLRNYSSIESWYESAVRGYYYVNFYKSSTFEDTIISGLPSRKILEPRNSFHENGASCYVTAILYKNRIFEICDTLHNEMTKNIINSFNFNDQLVKTSIQNNLLDYISRDEGKASGKDRNAIFRDNSSWTQDIQNVYETKDKIYFGFLSEKDSCGTLHILDKVSQKYYGTQLTQCPTVEMVDTLPYYIHIETNEFSTTTKILYSLNLITGKKTEIFRTEKDENLFSGYYGNWDVPVPDIIINDKDTIRINVFKQYKNAEELNKTSNSIYMVPRPEKIRDVLVKFRTP